MQNNQKSNSFCQCRLCGIPGNHEINIWDGNSLAEPETEHALSVKIFECVGVLVSNWNTWNLKCHISCWSHAVLCLNFQVRKDDETTRVCQECFDMINKYFPFRESCAARNINFMLLKIGVSIERSVYVEAAGGIDRTNSICEIISDEEKSSCDRTAPSVCITLTDTESEDGEDNDDSEHTGAHFGTSSAEVEPAIGKKHRLKNVGREKCPKFSERSHLNKWFECHLCKGTFSRLPSLKRHMRRIHGRGKRFTCPFVMCSRISYCKYGLQDHIKSRHTKKAISVGREQSMNCMAANKSSQGHLPVKCGWRSCKNFFESDGDALYHMAQYHARGSKKTYECHLCKISIVNVIALKQHMNAKHSHQKSFKCPFSDCTRIFHHIDSIRHHINIYHSRKAVSSGRNEQKTNNKLGDGRNNAKFPVLCGWRGCKQVFENQGAKLYHLAVFHRQGAKKTFQCYLCKGTLVSIGSLKQHMTGLHGRHTSLKCPFLNCSAVLKYSSGMERHIKNLHTWNAAASAERRRRRRVCCNFSVPSMRGNAAREVSSLQWLINLFLNTL